MDWLGKMFNVTEWQVHAADIGVMIGYLVLMVVVGWLCKGISGNISDYIRMGCKSTWWLMGASIFMQAISASTFTGGGAQAYLAGWSFILVGLSGVLGYLSQAAFFAPWLRRTRAITPADAVRQRYGRAVEQIYTYIGSFTGMFWGGTMLLGLAIFMAAVFNIPIPTVIVVVGIIVIFYSVSGGSWSVQVTDSLQGLIMVPICLVVTFLSLKAVGGLSGLFHEIQAQGLTSDYQLIKSMDHIYQTTITKVGKGYFTIPWMIASFINSFVISANMTGCWRYLSTKSDNEARKAALFAAALLFVGGFIWYIPPTVTRLKFNDEVVALNAKLEVKKALQKQAAELDEKIRQLRDMGLGGAAAPRVMEQTPPAPADLAAQIETLSRQRADLRTQILSQPALANAADGAYAIAARRVLPPGLLGLVVIAMFAATMSSLDSSLTGNAGLITNNLYPPLVALFGLKPWEGKKLLRLTQVVNLCMGVWAVFLALYMQRYLEMGGKSLFDLGLEIVLLFQTPMVMAMVLSFFVRRLPWWGPLVGMAAGFANSLIVMGASWIAEWFSSGNILVQYANWISGLPWHNKMYINSAITLLPTLATVLFWPTAKLAYRERVDKFFAQLRTPIDFRKEVGRDADHTLLKMVGGLGLIMAAAIAILLVFASDLAETLSVLFIVGFIAVISGIMFFFGLRKQRQVEAEAAAEAGQADSK